MTAVQINSLTNLIEHLATENPNKKETLTSLTIAKEILEKFHQEKEGVRIYNSPDQVVEYRKKFEPNLVVWDKFDTVKKKLDSFHDEEISNLFFLIQCYYLGMIYNIGEANGGENKLNEYNLELFGQLETKALEWKKSHPLAIDEELNPFEIIQLRKAACYPKWAALISKNEEYAKAFFNAVLRDGLPVKYFLMYPIHNRKILKEGLLTPYFTRRNTPNEKDAKEMKKIMENEGYGDKYVGPIRKKGERNFFDCRKVQVKDSSGEFKQWQITCPIYDSSDGDFYTDRTRRVSMINPDEIVEFKDHHISWQKIVEETGQKDLREVNYNVFYKGLTNCHPTKSPFHPKQLVKDHENEPDFLEDLKNNWIYRFPPAIQVSNDFVKAYHGDVKQDIFFEFTAARTSTDTKCIDCHTTLLIYIRQQDGSWNVLEPGIFADHFPQTKLEGMGMLCGTYPNDVTFLDQNPNYTHRHKAYFPVFPDSEEKTTKILARLFEIMTTEGVFQFGGGENCTLPLQETFQDVLGVLEEPTESAKNIPSPEKLPTGLKATFFSIVKKIIRYATYIFKLILDWIEMRIKLVDSENPILNIAPQQSPTGIPNLFLMKVVDVKIIGILDAILLLMKNSHTLIKEAIFTFMLHLFGAFRGLVIEKENEDHTVTKVWKSVLQYHRNNNKKFKEYVIANPSFLHHQIEYNLHPLIGKIGFLAWTHMDRYFPQRLMRANKKRQEKLTRQAG